MQLKQFVIGEPDVSEYDLTGDEDFIVVACDGVWDVMNQKEVGARVPLSCIRSYPGRLGVMPRVHTFSHPSVRSISP